MRITLFMAMSLNSMIATRDGREDFLSHTNWESFRDLAQKHGCFMVGRKTYDAVQQWPDYNFDDIDAKLKIVISSDKDLNLKSPYLVANSPKGAIEMAVAMNFESVILTGGSTINSEFITENLIDEIILNIEPVVLGDGIPLFAKCDIEKRLTFVESTIIANDVIQVKYKVNKN